MKLRRRIFALDWAVLVEVPGLTAGVDSLVRTWQDWLDLSMDSRCWYQALNMLQKVNDRLLATVSTLDVVRDDVIPSSML